MARETIASVRAEMQSMLNDATTVTHNATARADSALAALKSVQSEYGDTIKDLRRRTEQAEHRARDAETNAHLLRGFILAKVTSAELEAMPLGFAEYVRNGPEPTGPRISARDFLHG